MKKITPFLWFDNNAEEAINFYKEVFKNSEIINLINYPAETPNGLGGKVMMSEFRLVNQEFKAFDAGPHFKFNPAVSFTFQTKSVEDLDNYWKQLSEGGKILMEYQKYDFSEKYGWLEDKFGLSWQLTLGEEDEKITPSFLFFKENFGRGMEALEFYTSVFDNSKIGATFKYPDERKGVKDALMYSEFTVEGQDFNLMESDFDHDYVLNEAISFFVDCKDQEEVDYYWEKFTKDGGQESMCGWLKDKFGVSWQIIPRALGEMLGDSDREKAGRALEAMLKMKKIVVEDLKKAYEGK
jgi:predicted 3-demethylubiquinone-9 3-methyltransferase (glyoxalase superfamily)